MKVQLRRRHEHQRPVVRGQLRRDAALVADAGRSRADAVLRRRPHAAARPQHQLLRGRRAVTALLYASDRTVDQAERTRLLGDAQRRIADLLPETPALQRSPSSTPCRQRCRTSRATPPTPASSGTCTSGSSADPARWRRALPLLLVISAVVFGLLHPVPGGPLAVYLSNPDVRPEDLERLRRALGLDQPLWRQYVQWLGGLPARRLGLQLQRRPPRPGPRPGARAGDARTGLGVAAARDARRRCRWASRRRSRAGAGRIASRRRCRSRGCRCRCSGSASCCSCVLARPRLAAIVRPHHASATARSSIASPT